MRNAICNIQAANDIGRRRSGIERGSKVVFADSPLAGL